ncbi:hypothetical protein DdX_18558 [Ditylenchus destructor]|uniref:Uncharacterized protein n=1 Tax=Ditylenchus destructor TaxID=166010 RepID=A0AAD4MPA4_9BILA|nr:hypothetical protein DdX_18558 [Ditylenchus destructor]
MFSNAPYCHLCQIVSADNESAIKQHISSIHLNYRPYDCITCAELGDIFKTAVLEKMDDHGETTHRDTNYSYRVEIDRGKEAELKAAVENFLQLSISQHSAADTTVALHSNSVANEPADIAENVQIPRDSKAHLRGIFASLVSTDVEKGATEYIQRAKLLSITETKAEIGEFEVSESESNDSNGITNEGLQTENGPFSGDESNPNVNSQGNAEKHLGGKAERMANDGYFAGPFIAAISRVDTGRTISSRNTLWEAMYTAIKSDTNAWSAFQSMTLGQKTNFLVSKLQEHFDKDEDDRRATEDLLLNESNLRKAKLIKLSNLRRNPKNRDLTLEDITLDMIKDSKLYKELKRPSGKLDSTASNNYGVTDKKKLKTISVKSNAERSRQWATIGPSQKHLRSAILDKLQTPLRKMGQLTSASSSQIQCPENRPTTAQQQKTSAPPQKRKFILIERKNLSKHFEEVMQKYPLERRNDITKYLNNHTTAPEKKKQLVIRILEGAGYQVPPPPIQAPGTSVEQSTSATEMEQENEKTQK